jgi:hypothetical protein
MVFNENQQGQALISDNTPSKQELVTIPERIHIKMIPFSAERSLE